MTLYDTERTKIDAVRSRELIRPLGAYFKGCWHTCSRAVALERFSKLLPDCLYVEGWVALPAGLIIEHGWIETPDGTVIDPTYALHEPDFWPGTHRYFHGVAWTREECRKKRRSAKHMPFVYQNGWTADPEVFPAYWRASDDAHRAIFGQTPREIFAELTSLDTPEQA